MEKKVKAPGDEEETFTFDGQIGFRSMHDGGKQQYLSGIMDDILSEGAVSNISITFYYSEVPDKGRVLHYNYRCTNPLEVPYLLEVMKNLSVEGARHIDSARDH